MNDKELQEKWLKNNSVTKIEPSDSYIPSDGLKRSSKSFLENHAESIVSSHKNKDFQKLEPSALNTLSNYSLKNEDDLIGKTIRVLTFGSTTTVKVLRKQDYKYLCSDGKCRTKDRVIKQLLD